MGRLCTGRVAGYDLEDAVREAGALRLRPILLTTLAIALGAAIMVPAAVFGGWHWRYLLLS